LGSVAKNFLFFTFRQRVARPRFCQRKIKEPAHRIATREIPFSLEHPTKSVEAAPMEGATAPSEDSGMIDLKALAAKAESIRSPALSEVGESAVPVEAAPAQFAAPLGGYAPVDSEAAPKNMLPLFLGAGAGIVLLLVAGIAIGLKVGSRVAPAPVTTAIASAIPVPTVVATAEPSAAPSAGVTSEPSESAAPEAATTPKRRRHGGGAAHKLPAAGGGAGATAGDGAGASGATAATRAAGAGETQTAASPKKGDCGCKGDLTCMMKCSTH
jgi:hypothetical protein